jgi:hypothetical protein
MVQSSMNLVMNHYEIANLLNDRVVRKTKSRWEARVNDRVNRYRILTLHYNSLLTRLRKLGNDLHNRLTCFTKFA